MSLKREGREERGGRRDEEKEEERREKAGLEEEQYEKILFLGKNSFISFPVEDGSQRKYESKIIDTKSDVVTILFDDGETHDFYCEQLKQIIYEGKRKKIETNKKKKNYQEHKRIKRYQMFRQFIKCPGWYYIKVTSCHFQTKSKR